MITQNLEHQHGHPQSLSLNFPVTSSKDVEISTNKMDQATEEENFDVPEQVEDIIEHLLSSLKDKVETIGVNWFPMCCI
mgnify:FL=1